MGGHYDRDIYKQLMEVMAKCDRLDEKISEEKAAHRKEIAGLKAEHRKEIAALKAEHRKEVDALNQRIAGLERENGLLRGEVERLKSNANNNSGNSSLPPSSDQKPSKRANEYNGRERSGRKPGGQKGHEGKTLTREYVEEKIHDGKFEHEVMGIGRESGSYVKRYVLDINVRPVAKEVRIYADENGKYAIPEEYRSPVSYGTRLKSMVVALYGEGVVSEARIARFITDMTDGELDVSEGSVYGFCKEFARKSARSIEAISRELLGSRVLYTDATTVTVSGRQEYVRNQSTDGAVLYSPMEKKNIESIRGTGILGAYAGTTVNDHETALYHFGTDTGECNAHLARYLRKNTEETGNEWGGKMTGLLCEFNDRKKGLVESGTSGFEAEELDDLSRRYDEIVAQGREQNNATKSKYAKAEEKALLNRLEKYKHSHLLFAYDFNVGYTNNMSERDLRKVKNRQKMSGGFRKTSGKEMYCTILSIIETCKRKGMKLLESFERIFMGSPAIF